MPGADEQNVPLSDAGIEVPQIEISFEQLRFSKDESNVAASAGQGHSEKPVAEKPKKARRPDVAIYRPTRGRHSLGKSQDSSSSVTSPGSANVSDATSTASQTSRDRHGSGLEAETPPTKTSHRKSQSPLDSADSGRTKKKRPEQAKYMPKNHQAKQPEDDEVGESGEGEHSPPARLSCSPVGVLATESGVGGDVAPGDREGELVSSASGSQLGDVKVKADQSSDRKQRRSGTASASGPKHADSEDLTTEGRASDMADASPTAANNGGKLKDSREKGDNGNNPRDSSGLGDSRNNPRDSSGLGDSRNNPRDSSQQSDAAGKQRDKTKQSDNSSKTRDRRKQSDDNRKQSDHNRKQSDHNRKQSGKLSQSHNRTSTDKSRTEQKLGDHGKDPCPDEGLKLTPRSEPKRKSVSFGPDMERNPASVEVDIADLESSITALSIDEAPQRLTQGSARVNNKISPHKQRRDGGRRSKEGGGRPKESETTRSGGRSEGKLYDPRGSSESAQESTQSRAGLLRLSTARDADGADASAGRWSSSGDSRVLYDPKRSSSPVSARYSADSERRYIGDGDYSIYNRGSEATSTQMYTVPPNSSPYSYSRSAEYYTPSAPEPFYEMPGYTSLETPVKHRKLGLLIRDVVPLDRQLSTLVSRRLTSESLSHINRLRSTVREKLEQILLLDLEYSTNHNVDQLLWKSVYHNILENMRGDLQNMKGDTQCDTDYAEEDEGALRDQINNILDEADTNYRALLAKLERQGQFDLAHFTAAHRLIPGSRTLKLSLILCQRILICLGDVARYRTQNRRSSDSPVDYGRARKLYLQASSVASRNGKPYNQLAIIALYAKRRLDTVFYFIRSIAASNAFLSAKESLQAIYSDVMKKYSQMRQEVAKRKLGAQKHVEHVKSSSSHKRVELWISPIDGTSVTNQVDEDTLIDNPRTMPCNELYKRLMTTFLSCQGMIFSKLGMEHFPEASSQVLYQLEALLSHSPIPLLDLPKLIQMFAVCMFSIQHAGLQVDAGSLDREKCRSYTQEQAVLLYVDMTTVVIKRCTALLTDLPTAHGNLSVSQLTSHDLLLLLPLVKLTTDWMTCHPHLWNPQPCPRDPLLGPVLDPWLAVTNLSNALTHISGVSDIEFHTGDDVDLMAAETDRYIWLTFQEELDLRGFLPLMNLANDDVFIESRAGVSQVEAAMAYRVKTLITFADYLCGIEPPMLDFDTQAVKYWSLVDPPVLSEKTTPAPAATNPQNAADSDGYSDSGSDAAVSDAEVVDKQTDPTAELRRTKKRLSKQLASQEKQRRVHQAVLDSEAHGVIRLEIRPTFVVPDTNCFIEYLSHMKALIASQRFTVVVPLIVINELDGLSRNSALVVARRSADAEHAENVRKEAINAIEFLESEFVSRNRRLKALTVSGTELSTIAYRSEDTSNDGTNDDKILSCCLNYCKDNARDFMPKDKDSTITLYREVVLVTDDRNLRLKAHTRNVPVKDLIRFMEWAAIRC